MRPREKDLIAVAAGNGPDKVQRTGSQLDRRGGPRTEPVLRRSGCWQTPMPRTGRFMPPKRSGFIASIWRFIPTAPMSAHFWAARF
jgi:hypothetical protein